MRFTKRSKALPVMLMSFSVLLSGCDFFDNESPVDDVVLPEPKPPIQVEPEVPVLPDSTQVNLTIVNAADGTPVNAGSLTVLSDTLNVVLAASDIVNGQATLSIAQEILTDDDANGYPDFAAKLTVGVNASGFLTTNSDIIVDVYGDNYATTNMVSLLGDNAPQGVTSVVELVDFDSTATIVNDSGVEVIEVSTQDSDSADSDLAVVSLQIPTDVVFQSNDGVALDNSKLEISVTSFNADSEQALALLPGGLNAEVSNAADLAAALSDENTQVSVSDSATVRLISAGFAAIEISDGTNHASNISSVSPISIQIPLANGVLNPETNELTKVGDIIPVWSLSSGDVAWLFEGEGEVALNNQNALVVNIDVRHLSYFNLAWADVADTCSGSFKIRDVNGDAFDLAGQIELTSERNRLTDNYNGSIDGILTFDGLPNEPTTFSFYSENGTALVIHDKTELSLTENGAISNDLAVISGIDLCNTQDGIITLQQQEQPTPVIDLVNNYNYVREGDDGNTIAQFVVQLLDPPTKAVSFDYTVSESNTVSAVAGEDFVAVNAQTVTFAVGETEKVINVEIIADTIIESRYEWFKLTLTNAVGASFEKAVNSVESYARIIDNDKLTVTAVIVNSANEADAAAHITVTFEEPVTELAAAQHPYLYYRPMAVNGDDAQLYLDFNNPSEYGYYSPILLAAGMTEVEFSIPLRDDLDVEGDEAFAVSLWSNNIVDVTAHRTTAVVIKDNDADIDNQTPTAVNVEVIGADEFSEGQTNYLLVSLDTATNADVSVSYTLELEATGIIEEKTLTFTPGQSSQLIPVGIDNDTIVNFDRDLTITISSAIDGDFSHTFKLLDNDNYYVRLDAYLSQHVAVEGIDDNVVLRYSYTSTDDNITLSMQSSVAPGTTATVGEDYTATLGGESFTGLSEYRESDIVLVNDDVAEPTELLNLMFTATNIQTSGKTVVSFGDDWDYLNSASDSLDNDLFFMQQLTITNDDLARFFITSATTLQLETNEAGFAASGVALTLEMLGLESFAEDLTFSVTAIDDTAQAGVHYTAPEQTATLAAGSNTLTINVDTPPVSNADAGVSEANTHNAVNFGVKVRLSQASVDRLKALDVQWLITQSTSDVTIDYTLLFAPTGGTGGSSSGG